MKTATAAQIRAARGLLNWSQAALAKAANVSRATIQGIENNCLVRPGKIHQVHEVLLENGIEFLDHDGVKRLPEGMKDFMGGDSCERFFKNVEKVLKDKGGELICQVQTPNIMNKATCTTYRTNLERLEQIHAKGVSVKCLILDDKVSFPKAPQFDARILLGDGSLLTSTFTYGNELAIAYTDNDGNFVYVIFTIPHLVNSSLNYFTRYWPVAQPLQNLSPSRKRAA